MSEFKKTWYTLPYHIRKLPGMTLSLLDFYETIFEFWNNGKDCYLSNALLMERTGIKSISTIQECFQYFEKHNLLKRVQKNNKRYIVRVFAVESDDVESESVDNSDKNSTKDVQGIATAIGGYRHSDRGGIATAIHKNNKLENINNNKKLLYAKTEEQKKSIVKEWSGLAETAKHVNPILQDWIKNQGVCLNDEQLQKNDERMRSRKGNYRLSTPLPTENVDNLGMIV